MLFVFVKAFVQCNHNYKILNLKNPADHVAGFFIVIFLDRILVNNNDGVKNSNAKIFKQKRKNIKT